jgi:two-component system nitrate/nitrite response regulator NarL
MRRQCSFETILVGRGSLLKEGLAEILRAANFRILTSVSCAHDLPAGNFQPCQQLFLMVHTGDDFESAVEQIEIFKSRHRGGRIAIVADRCRLDEMVSAFRAGASGYFNEVVTSDILIKSLELVMMGETVFSPALLSLVLDSARIRDTTPREDNNDGILMTSEGGIEPQLSPRQISILGYLIEGNSNKSIARKVDIAEATVKVHVKAILRKLGVHNRTQAAIWAMSNGSLARAPSHSRPV